MDRLGGPTGSRARPHWWWTPVRLLLALCAVSFALSLVQHAPCINNKWLDKDVRYSKMCYSDVPYLYTDRGFAEQAWPYAEDNRYPAMEYPVLISYAAWLTSEVVALSPAGPIESVRAATPTTGLWGLVGMSDEATAFFLVTAALMCAAGLFAAWFLAGVHRGRPWDALPFVLSPALLMTGLVNWDMLAVVCVAGALWAWARGKPLLAGVMVGLGTAAKLYPLFLLGAFLIVALRETNRRRWFGWAIAGAAGAWTLAQVPAWLGDWSRWTHFWTFNADRSADLGSVWLLLTPWGINPSAHQINLVSWLVFGLACIAILGLGLAAPRTPRVAQSGLLIVMAFLMINKVYSPQYVLWLLPLAVLARPRWRDLLIWQAGELAYFGAVWLYLGTWLQNASDTQAPAYDLAILLRLIAQAYLAVMVIRDILRPEHDPLVAERSVQDHVVDVGRGEAHPDLDLLAEVGHPR